MQRLSLSIITLIAFVIIAFGCGGGYSVSSYHDGQEVSHVSGTQSPWHSSTTIETHSAPSYDACMDQMRGLDRQEAEERCKDRIRLHEQRSEWGGWGYGNYGYGMSYGLYNCGNGRYTHNPSNCRYNGW